MAGRVTPIRKEDAERKERFGRLVQAIQDGSINEDTPMIIYFEPLTPETGEVSSLGNVFVLNMKEFEVITYLEMMKAMIMKDILVESEAR